VKTFSKLQFHLGHTVPACFLLKLILDNTNGVVISLPHFSQLSNSHSWCRFPLCCLTT